MNVIKRFQYIITQNRDAKILVQNFAYLSILQVIGSVFPLITYPYLVKVIGLANFGSIAFASSVVTYCLTITDWGFMFTATRDIAQNRDNREKISQIFSSVTLARLFLMLISFILLSVLIICSPLFKQYSCVILITFLLIPGHIMFPEWLFQGLERMKYITILNFLSKLIFTILTFLLIKKESDYILQPLFISLGYIVSGMIALYFIIIKWKIAFRLVSMKEVVITIRQNQDIFLNNFVPNLYNSFSVLLLGIWGGSVANGIYAAADKVITIFNQFLLIVSRTFFPFLSRKIDKHAIFARCNIIISIGISILIFLFAPFLIHTLFSNEFENAILVLRILSLSILFLTLSNVYGTNFLIIQRQEKILRKITVNVSILGLFLSTALIYWNGFIGAALSITITRAILSILITINALKLKNNIHV